MLDDEAIYHLNKPTKTGKASQFLHAWLSLGCGKTKLSELNVHSVRKSNDPIIQEEEPYDTPTPPEIPESPPIDNHLQLNGTEVTDE